MDKKETIIVSACLLGKKCTYKGSHNINNNVKQLSNKYRLIPVCPEILGGLKVPRTPSEIKGDRVFFKTGMDVTSLFALGAQKALGLFEKNKGVCAVLKENSPSCGTNYVYDGSFSGKLISGMGITAKLFREKGIKVISEREVEEIDSL